MARATDPEVGASKDGPRQALASGPGPRRGVPPRLAHAGIDAAYGALGAVLLPWALGRAALDPKARARWTAYLRDVHARFAPRAPRASKAPCVWIHGVSVGEVKAATRLVDSIERLLPEVEILVTATTDTGYRVARDRYPGRRVEFYPPDLSWVVGRAFDRLRPDVIVLLESEFWPNFLTEARSRDVPVALVNGRISERSARRFRRAGPIVRSLVDALALLCVQLPVHAERFVSVGVPRERIAVTGNLKLDNVPVVAERARSAALARLLGAGVPRPAPLLVAGSTHPPEERLLGTVLSRLRARGGPLRCVVAPRHPSRAAVAEAELGRAGLTVVRRSRLGEDAPAPTDAVVLLDSVGELEEVYSFADVVFVGGSLVRHGGQNMMEPASLAKPVVVGPHVWNFRGEVDLLRAAEGIVVAEGVEQVFETLAGWLADPAQAARVGARGRDAILASKGATARTMEVLGPLLAGRCGPARAAASVSSRRRSS